MAASGRRIVAALIYGALASAAVIAVIAALANWQYGWMTFAIWLALGFGANLILASTLGLAWHAFAYRRGWRGVIAYVLPAAVLGLAIPLGMFALPPLLAGNGLDLHSAAFVTSITSLIGVALGGMTGLFAWLIRRPDRDGAPNPPTSAP